MTTIRTAALAGTFLTLLHPLLALAQQTQQPTTPQQPPWDWPGPWHMWHGGWGFWWVFPLFMLFMIAVCVVVFLLAHRSGGHRPLGTVADDGPTARPGPLMG